jgi:hypothetical protein
MILAPGRYQDFSRQAVSFSRGTAAKLLKTLRLSSLILFLLIVPECPGQKSNYFLNYLYFHSLCLVYFLIFQSFVTFSFNAGAGQIPGLPLLPPASMSRLQDTDAEESLSTKSTVYCEGGSWNTHICSLLHNVGDLVDITRLHSISTVTLALRWPLSTAARETGPSSFSRAISGPLANRNRMRRAVAHVHVWRGGRGWRGASF